MSNFAWIIIIIITLIIGMILGFFIARRYMMNYFQDNPPISADMIRTMMAQMGQKPSEKRAQQIINSMKKTKK
ncbi:YneF family protein [Aerococcus loyolae]|uniref:YneF family protein n=1 Tax=Aerococcus loyolae TaxID=2976809 RepID=UPI000DCD81C0|nr:YneF family protein [Aerococcus loyolae]RAV69497.1 YneF family protein [Aerococcus loyolae]